ncbi:uncharacterized protein LOC62_04G005827 [Vanrija pseudolonga]|uniref:Protein BIG1 n=1 Tax=Vanrija pseudolonga TaxID=143232 RepID=A0AAF1BRK9_9TREE|nr:hypothetical protein LOC62_04G005827 [Vanrija pseudolonga]
MRFSPSVGAATALVLAASARAFRDSSPLFVWSSTPNDALLEAANEVSSGVINADSVFNTLKTIGCDWDAIVVAHQDELHQSHIEKISLPYAPAHADLHIPYLIRPTREGLDEAVTSWAAECGAELIDEYKRPADGERVMVYFNAEHGSDVTLPTDLPKRHLVVVTGTRDLSKRQNDEKPFMSEAPTSSHTATLADEAAAPGNGTKPGRDETAYLTTPIIVGLLLSFGVLLPILLVGISQLAAIQVPPRMLEISKTLSVNKDRKDQ